MQIFNEALLPNQIQFLFNNVGQQPPAVLACDVDLANGCTIADLQTIANNFFNNTMNRSDGDLNDDGIVNFADYRIWKDASGSGATLAEVMGSVPEPGSIALISLALCSFGVRRPRR